MQTFSAKFIFVISINFIIFENIFCIERTTKSCALLYNKKNLEGQSFPINDDEQVSNFDEEHISKDNVWNQTLSFQVTNGCHLTVYNETYFTGNSQKFRANRNEPPSEFASILSAHCSCDKDCKCSDIRMSKSSCARAYFKPGCNVCNSYYADLKGQKNSFPQDYSGKIETITVRDGCQLTVYDDEDLTGDSRVVNGIVENWILEIKSYECECSSRQPKPTPKPVRPSSYPPYINLPTSIQDISVLLSGAYKGHPGLIAAKKSFQNKRSSKNVYMLAIGSTGAGKSSTINLLFDNENVTRVGATTSTTKSIHEFRIRVPIDELGVENSELRVIDTPGMGDTHGLEEDAKFLATLDDYLTNHEELHERIPNVVLIFHKFTDNRFSGPASNFVKMLRGFDSLRKRITDPNFSNVIFVLTHFCGEVKKVKEQPNKRLAQFKDVIESYSQFPKPIMIVVAENKPEDQELPMLNGYYKLPNGDYYPRNLFDKIRFATSNAGDPIGEAVITMGFRNADNFEITPLTHRLVGSHDKRLSKYHDILSRVVLEIENTEISQDLAVAYDTMSPTLKRTYAGVLPYLQKALSVRNIRNRSEIPKTTVGILTLLSSLKQNEAIAYLLENALNIKPPRFPENVVTGYSFNVFQEAPLSMSPYQLGALQNSDIGYLLLSAMTCNVENQNKNFMYVKESRKEYIKQRLSNLGIDGHLSEEKYTADLKPGFNIITESSQLNKCKITAIREFRRFSLVLNDKPSLNTEFSNTLQSLPVFNESVIENVNVWNKFFKTYGTHVVKQVHGGGAIEVTLESNKACDDQISETLLGLVQFAEDLTALSDESRNALGKGDIRHVLNFKGGDARYHTSDLTQMSLDDAFTLMQNWKESLRLNPVILKTEMQLLPLSEVSKKFGRNISSEVERATLLLFNSSLIYVSPPSSRNNLPDKSRGETELSPSILKVFSTMIQPLLDQLKLSEERYAKLLDELKKNQEKFEKQREKEQALFQKQLKELQELQEKAIAHEKQKREEDLGRHKADMEAYQKQLKELQELQDKKFADEKQKREEDLARHKADMEANQKQLKEQQGLQDKKFADEKQKREKDLARHKADMEANQKQLKEQQGLQDKKFADEKQKREKDLARHKADMEAKEKQWQKESEKRKRELASIEEAHEKHRREKEAQPPPKKKCLVKGTLILHVDGSEKPVEHLRIGDILLDSDLSPTKVLGVSSEYLMEQKLYGFDNNSFFFTDDHIFAGPLSQAHNVSKGLQFYAKNKDSLLRTNPLLEYVGILEMSSGGFNIYKYENSNRSVAQKWVKVFEDPIRHPSNTLVYHIRVDSPVETYFANGYVCRHEHPPLEIWPNTIATLFSLHSNPEYRHFEKVVYNLTSAPVIYQIISDVRLKVGNIFGSLIVEDLDEDYPKLEADAQNAELVIGNMYTHSTFPIFAMGLYNHVGPVMSKHLDNCNVNSCIPDKYVGSVQKLLREEMSKQIVQSIQIKMNPSGVELVR